MSAQAGETPAAARAEGVSKIYGQGPTAVRALDNVTVAFPRARFTAIMGPSGSGKSTLMHCVAGLDTVTTGEVWIGNTALSGLNDKDLTAIRRDRIGFIFQDFNLIPTLTAGENIRLTTAIAGHDPDPQWFDFVVKTVGLGARLEHRPAELSGGQQQRVAVARALIARPEVIFGDEPTGNLDSQSGTEVLQFMRRSVDDLGLSVVMVTHDARAASYADSVLFLADGKIVHDMPAPTADDVLDFMKTLAA